jgi:cyclopropane-fatty-acyl-phospholipid synthase
MTYSSGIYLSSSDSLEQAQTNKLNYHYKAANITPEKRVLDIGCGCGCGWGSNIEFLSRDKGVLDIHGLTLSKDQHVEILSRKIPNVSTHLINFLDFNPKILFDAVISLEMFEHVATPEDARNNRDIEKYREYFKRAWEWTNPGSYFSLQSCLGARIPRGKILRELAWTTKAIFPGAISPRIERILEGIAPYWELIDYSSKRLDYAKTCNDWLDRLKENETEFLIKWGEIRFTEYVLYLNTCINIFENNYQNVGFFMLKRID